MGREGLNAADRQVLDGLRIALMGSSVIDTGGLSFATGEAVDRFLGLLGFDMEMDPDKAKLRELLEEAVTYLSDVHDYDIPSEVAQPAELRNLFLLASDRKSSSQVYACMVLKVMHIVHHLTARELLFATSVSEADLLSRLNSKVMRVIDDMRRVGISLVEFRTGKKSRMSVMTKLLAKRNNVAARVYDKLRFRLVLSTREEVLAALIYLLKHLIPYNYVVPEQSQNGIISLEDVVAVVGVSKAALDSYWGKHGVGQAREDIKPTPSNMFSGGSYHTVNFVAEIPLRIDDIVGVAPAMVFAQTEIQLVDRQTDERNKSGENAHALYKERKRNHVRARLESRDPSGKDKDSS